MKIIYKLNSQVDSILEKYKYLKEENENLRRELEVLRQDNEQLVNSNEELFSKINSTLNLIKAQKSE